LKPFSVEDAFVDNAGVVGLVSRSEQGIVRWDTVSQTFLSTLPLRGRPTFSSYAPASGRVVLSYSDGSLTDLFPGSNVNEQVFGYIPSHNIPFSLVALDELTFLNVRLGYSSADFRIILGPVGELKSLSGLSYWGAGQAWQSGSRRLYSMSRYSYNDGVEYIAVPSTGVIPTTDASPVNNVIPPLRFSSDGGLVLTGNGRILNADLQQVGSLQNIVTDGVWLPDGFYSIRPRPNGTELQSWARITYANTGSLTIPGTPLRIFKLADDRVVVVTLVNGYVAFSRVSANLSLLSYSVNSPGSPGAPVITSQPSGRTVNRGESVTFAVTASGTPTPSIQWQRNGTNIAGATASTYHVGNATIADAGDYRAVVTNSAGSVSSVPAGLTVLETSYPQILSLYRQILQRNVRWDELAANTITVSNGGRMGRIYRELLQTAEYRNRQIESVIRLYYAGLARPPDYGGLMGWSGVLEQGQSTLAEVAQAFVNSVEFQNRYGNLNDSQFVRQLYRNVLGREADAGGLTFWVSQINGGATRGEVLAGFSDSPEFQELMIEEVNVQRAYALLLGRMPSYEELKTWKGYLRGQDQTDAFLDSAEFVGLHPEGLSNSLFVAFTYEGFLRRGVDPAGQAFWVGELENGRITRAELVYKLISSDEYRDIVSTVGRFYLGCLNRLPDADGLAGWTGYLRGGHSAQELAQGFANAPEFQQQMAGLTNAGFVQQLYRGVLGREADAAGLAGWTTLLDTAQFSRTNLLEAFIQSQEAVDRFDPDVRTYLHYLAFLQRSPSAGELAVWYLYLSALQDEFVQELIDSPGFGNG
jgi:hypothetical protein